MFGAEKTVHMEILPYVIEFVVPFKNILLFLSAKIKKI